MSDVKWVKITTDMFDNRKIKYLRTLPEGNNIVLIWVMLLTIAGRCNAGGMIFLTENIPYNYNMLADELGFDVSTVKLALDALSQLGMIICDESEFAISNWGEYQNVEGMDKVREQGRLRQERYRERQKQLVGECNVTHNVTDNATVTDSSYSISYSSLSSSKSQEGTKKKETKKEKGARVFTPPSLEDVVAYCEERNSTVDPNKFYDYYNAGDWKDAKGNPVKNWKQKLITWESKDGEKHDNGRNNGNGKQTAGKRDWGIRYDN